MTGIPFDFAGLSLMTDARLLSPRGWTVAQADWARELLACAPTGPVLEMCAGAGHIGLAAVRDSSRRLVAVDREPVATACIEENARRLGIGDRVETRCGAVDSVLQPGEAYGMVIADPPWVPHTVVGEHPEDPPAAIDGGADGLDVAHTCLDVIAQHLQPGGCALVQLGEVGQVRRLRLPPALHLGEVRAFPRGALARVDRAAT